MTRGERVALGGVLVLGLVLRLAYLHELSADVLFEHPGLDEEEYMASARAWARLEPNLGPFWQPPGIPLFLAPIVRVFGPGLQVPRLISALSGVVTAALSYALARGLLSVRSSIAVAAIVGIHGVLVFSGAELLPANLAALLDVAALCCLVHAKSKTRWALLAGALLGLAMLFTPSVAGFGLIAFLYLWRFAPRRSALAFSIALVLPVAPVIAWNRLFVDTLSISMNGGLNFFIGNNPSYLESFAIRPGAHWEALLARPWKEARIPDPASASSWFFERGLEHWVSEPGHATWTWLKKLWLFFHSTEITRDTDIYAVRAESWVLRVLVGPRHLAWPNGVLLPLAAIGALEAFTGEERRARTELFLPVTFVLSQALFYACFFVCSRYRVPCLPVLAILSVVGVEAILRATAKRRMLLGLAALGLLMAITIPSRETTLAFPAERELYRGLAFAALGDRAAAEEHWKLASETDPRDPRPWVELGRSRTARGDHESAAQAWERAARADPAYPRR